MEDEEDWSFIHELKKYKIIVDAPMEKKDTPFPDNDFSLIEFYVKPLNDNLIIYMEVNSVTIESDADTATLTTNCEEITTDYSQMIENSKSCGVVCILHGLNTLLQDHKLNHDNFLYWLDITINVSFTNVYGDTSTVDINLAAQYVKTVNELKEEYQLENTGYTVTDYGYTM